MADKIQPWISLSFFFFLFQAFLFPLCFGQLGPPQNTETFYPITISPPSSSPSPSPSNSNQTPPLVSPQTPPPKPSSRSDNKIAKAVAATAASTLVVTGLAFLLIQRWIVARRKRKSSGGNIGTNSKLDGCGGGGGVTPRSLQSRSEFVRYEGDLKGFIVDENGLDVLYWRKLDRRNSSSEKGLRKEVLRNNLRAKEGRDEDDDDNDDERNVVDNRRSRRKNEKIQETPLLRGKSSTSHVKVVPEVVNSNGIKTSSIPPKQSVGIVFKDVQEPELEPSRSSAASPPPPPSLPPTPPPLRPAPISAIPKKSPPPPPPPPIPPKKAPTPPPPPPPKARSLNSLSKPPPLPPRNREQTSGEGTSGTGNGQVKLKPLHWDKVNTNPEHSMVWDKINDNGSFRFDGDLMEALFGYVATNRKSPKENNNNNNNNNKTQSKSGPSAQTFILDTRKSQNTAIVLKSLYVSRKEVIDALMEGQGLSQETLEKLSRITPTEEEQSQILEYTGDPTRLADAECFLFHILKAVPSAFTRLNAMLYRSNYGPEIVHLKDSIQTLELACKELRTRGLFVKLLEAILKAGNRMNAGTSRGNAQAFDLTALRKLSDVRSTDGKTTLLHFVVEEVVRSEGKRCVMNRNRSLSRSGSQSSSSRSLNSDNYNQTTSFKEEREKEYVMLGLPVVGGLSSEFSNVKKAASIDYDNFSSACVTLSTRTREIRKLIVSQSVKGGFAREMEGFIESAEEEVKMVGDEQKRVTEVVRKTTEYYQAGASKNKGAHPFQLFIVVSDFLRMVDQVCVEIARNLQRKRGNIGSGVASSPKSPPPSRVAVRFANLPENFMSDKSSGRNSSDSDNE